VLKFREISVPTAIGVFVFTIFLNEVNDVPPSMPHALSLLGMPVAYQVCGVMGWLCLTLQVTGNGCGKIHNEKLRNLYTSHAT
jgi:hypothetical protein